MRIIGDIHTKWPAYQKLCKSCESSIQVGDFGIGFLSVQNTDFMNDWMIENPTHKFINGNHDKPALCKKMTGYLPNGVYDEMMVMGGAFSHDKIRRTEGVDWWADEELSNEELYEMVDLYEKSKPKVMITHEGPLLVVKDLILGNYKHQTKTRTGQALQAMFEIHQPDLWVFGHYHEYHKSKFGNTEFVCLEELGWMDI